jgi:hypothetical protein
MAINFKAKNSATVLSGGSGSNAGQRKPLTKGDWTKIGVDAVSTGGGFIAGLGKNKQERRIRQQLQQNINMSKEQQANTNTLGRIDISNQMGLSLASRLSGALQMTGSNAETYAQEGRNASYNLGMQLYQYDVEQTNYQNQINESKARSKSNIFNSIIGGVVGAGKAVASIYTGGATAGA